MVQKDIYTDCSVSYSVNLCKLLTPLSPRFLIFHDRENNIYFIVVLWALS